MHGPAIPMPCRSGSAASSGLPLPDDLIMSCLFLTSVGASPCFQHGVEHIVLLDV